MDVFHVERLPIHGGSMRLYACQQGRETIRATVQETLDAETRQGVRNASYYQRFSEQATRVRNDLITFLDQQSKAGKRLAAYGASAKGSTLLNYVGEAARSLEFIADRSTYKQGRLSPGLHVPIVAAQELATRGPDYAVLLVWNFAEEVMTQQQEFLANGGRFVIPLPKLTVA